MIGAKLSDKNFFFHFFTSEREKTQYGDKSWPPFLSCFKKLCAGVFLETTGCFFGFADLLVEQIVSTLVAPATVRSLLASARALVQNSCAFCCAIKLVFD
jgi:hypothetical protein